VVVQRWHPSVTGGSEALAWQYAGLLKDRFEVDLLTTTATDPTSWAHELAEGCTEEEGIQVSRFRVEQQRTEYWHGLHTRLIEDLGQLKARGRLLDYREGWTTALQEEFIAKQGPYAPQLWRFIEANHQKYAALIFVTYLYPTTYFGIEAARSHPNLLLVPTLHDEAPAYLSAYRRMARQARSLLWNSSSERDLTFDLWSPLPGSIVSMAISCKLVDKVSKAVPFLLYSGRIDPGKGCVEMLNYFIEFKKRHPSTLQLKLTGVCSMEIPPHPEIEFLGFVSGEEKQHLMRNATAFVMPSKNESLSIATLEAMAQETPVLANARGLVVADHIRKADSGLLFADQETFIEALTCLASKEDFARETGARGRRYVLDNYAEDRVRERLFRAIQGFGLHL
jgi:glycosyltransferase involved in cell wall biosynthesis